MSAAQLIPMISPDGQPGHVVANEVDAAVKAGYKRGTMVTAPTGEDGVVAMDELPAALKAGYKPKVSSAAPQQQLLNAPNQPGLQPTTSAWQHLGNMASDAYTTGTIPGMVSALTKVGSMYMNAKANERQRANEVAAAQGQPQPNSNAMTTALRMGADTSGLISGANSPTGMAVAGATVAAPVAAGAGLIGYGGYKAYQNKDALIDLLTKGQANPQQAQEGLMGLGTMAGGASLAGGALSPAKATYKTPAETPDVARIVTDTVNPPPKAMTAFESNVKAQLPEVLQGKEVNTRADLAKAFKETADTKKQAYYDQYINPLKDEVAANGQTIGSLDKRITEINATLRPQFEKGGATARAALSAQEKAQLNAELAQNRTALNEAVAQKRTVPVEQVAAARQKFGQMYDVADKMNLALNKERYAANEAAKAPPKLDITMAGAANAAKNYAVNKVLGNPADRALQTALKNYSPTAPDSGVPPVLQPKTPVQLTPIQRQAMMQTALNKTGVSTQLSPTDFSPDIQSAQQVMSKIGSRNPVKQPTPTPPLTELQQRAIRQAAQNRSQR